MFLPSCDCIPATYAHRLQDGFPEPLFRLSCHATRKDLCRPGRRRNGHDAPSILVAHEARTVLEQSSPCRLLRRGQPLWLNVMEDFRISRGDRHKRSPLLCIIRIKQALPLGKLRKHRTRRHPVFDVVRHLIIPAHDHLVRTSAIRLLREQARKRRARERRIDDENLLLL